MKRATLFIFLILIIFSSIASAQNDDVMRRNYLFKETFDGTQACGDGSHTNCDNTWTLTGNCTTRDFNYATSPAPLQGSYSLYMDAGGGDDCSTIHTFTAMSPVYAYARVNAADIAPTAGVYQTIFRFMNSATQLCVAEVGDSTGDKFCVSESSDGSTHSCGTTVPANATTYHLWLEYTKGTGANSVCTLYVSTDGVKPGSAEVSKTNGAATLNADTILLRASDSATEHFDQVIFDRILIDDIAIGSNP